MLPSATNGHSRTVYGILGMNCIGLPLFSVLTAVCKVIVSMNKRGRFLIRTVLRNNAVFVSFILIFQCFTHCVCRIAPFSIRKCAYGASFQPAVRNPPVECRACNSQSFGQFLFTEQPTARIRREKHFVSMCRQPMIKMTNSPCCISDCRFVILVCPHM